MHSSFADSRAFASRLRLLRMSDHERHMLFRIHPHPHPHDGLRNYMSLRLLSQSVRFLLRFCAARVSLVFCHVVIGKIICQQSYDLLSSLVVDFSRSDKKARYVFFFFCRNTRVTYSIECNLESLAPQVSLLKFNLFKMSYIPDSHRLVRKYGCELEQNSLYSTIS